MAQTVGNDCSDIVAVSRWTHLGAQLQQAQLLSELDDLKDIRAVGKTPATHGSWRDRSWVSGATGPSNVLWAVLTFGIEPAGPCMKLFTAARARQLKQEERGHAQHPTVRL